jgi:putative ABC transport system permease protein
VEPILGRTFLAEEEQEGNDRVVILAESLWRSRFNADPSLVTQSILVDEPHEVIGIVPASFRLPYFQDTYVRFEVFHPLVLNPEELARPNGNFNYGPSSA